MFLCVYLPPQCVWALWMWFEACFVKAFNFQFIKGKVYHNKMHQAWIFKVAKNITSWILLTVVMHTHRNTSYETSEVSKVWKSVSENSWRTMRWCWDLKTSESFNKLFACAGRCFVGQIKKNQELAATLFLSGFVTVFCTSVPQQMCCMSSLASSSLLHNPSAKHSSPRRAKWDSSAWIAAIYSQQNEQVAPRPAVPGALCASAGVKRLRPLSYKY